MLSRFRRAVQRAKAGHFHEQRARFLNEVTLLLSSSLDLTAMYGRIAELAISCVADWCLINILDDRGRPVCAACAHKDPEKLRLKHEMCLRYPPEKAERSPLMRVLRSRQPEFHPDFSEALLVEAAHSPEHLEGMRSFNLALEYNSNT